MLLKKLVFLIIGCLIVACTSRNESTRTPGLVSDSTTLEYKISKNRKLPIEQRKEAINKSYQDLKNHVDDSLYEYVLDQKSLLHFTAGEYDSLVYYSNLLLNHNSKNENASLLAEHYYLLGYYFAEIKHDFYKGVESYSLSKEYYTKLNDSSQIGENLLNIGVIQKNNNDFFGSKETLTDALRYLKQPDKRANCYNTLATNHRKLLNFSDAVNYYQKAIDITDSDKSRLIYKNNLAASYIDDNELGKAIELLSRIKKDSVIKTTSKELARVQDNLAYAKWLSGESISSNAFEKPLKIRIKAKDERGQMASYSHLGEFYSKEDPRKAKAYFDSVIQLSNALKIPRAEKDALRQLMKLVPNDIKVKDRYVLLQDSLYDQELKVKTQFAKYRYDDTLKQESILRLEKKNAENQLEVAEQRNQKLISYSGLAFVLVLSVCGVFFFIQRARRLKQQSRTAKIEATYETEAEFSRKLHDDFAGKLNHAMVLLQNGSDTTEVLNVVDSLYSQSRDFSRKINDVDTGSRFKEVLFGMLSSYGKNTQLLVTGSKEVDWNILSDLTKKTLYKVLQELMINMQKHSGASIVSLDFEQTKTRLKILYADNGNGAAKSSLNNKNGLWNTEKRILAINGSLTFDSEKGEGFRAQVKIPN
ncbi:tetratricopeptide repeat-containing sensor histidine kinase [Zobellia uliginosa]|uniref:tetratricopeptide repeat-containing sensor histidine kinase n=1 Tax=Zobellia uliginosa TaxID=143224 RepID=UPI001C06A41A|nr:hypothetical protein [Zobellia uliginosa]MBU2947846.1 hypothetical protein [Zobellia uliginosa]